MHHRAPPLPRRVAARSGAWCSGLVAWVALGAGCGRDPILDRAEQAEPSDQMAPAPAPAPAAPAERSPGSGTGTGARGLGDPAPVVPAPPRPGAPAAPGPGTPADPRPGVPEEPPPGAAHTGPSVQLAGRVEVPAGMEGPVRLDAFDGDQRAAAATGQPPAVVAQARLEGPGPFALAVPAGAPVWLGGYVDLDGNGRPTPDEPAGWLATNPLATDTDHRGLVLVLEPAAGPAPGAPE